MNSKTMCDGNRTIVMVAKDESSVFAMNGSDTETMMCGDRE